MGYLIGCFLSGIHHGKMRFVHGVSYVWGTVWFLIEPASNYLPWLKSFVEPRGPQIMVATLVLGFALGLGLMFKPPRVTFCIKTTDTRICVLFADLFKVPHHIVVPVNEFFDSEIGLPVSRSSIHGKFIEQVFAGEKRNFERAVDDALVQRPALHSDLGI